MSIVSSFRRAYRGETEIDFIGRRRTWFVLSALFLLTCIGSFILRGLNLGIEFEGGLQISAPMEDGLVGDWVDPAFVAELEEVAAEAGATDPQVQVAEREGGERFVLVQTKDVEGQEVERLKAVILEQTGAAEIDDESQIGERWGADITNKALRGLLIFLVVVSAFITLRFEWKMALASLVALVHDLTITAGVYSLVGFEVTPASVVAILTILGYSLYDNVVVFDKVEEDTTKFAATGRMTYQGAANQAINEVFMRSLNTSLSTVLPVGALLFVGAGLFGASTLEDLALALLVGLLVGAYSSIFVATPLLAMLKEREPKYRNVRAKVLRDAKRSAALPASSGDGAAEVTEEEEREPATVGSAPSRPATPASSKPRAGTKKAKRRKRR